MFNPSRYLYTTELNQRCFIQKDSQNGRYYVCVGEAKRVGGLFYATAEAAQAALDAMASDLGRQHEDINGRDS